MVNPTPDKLDRLLRTREAARQHGYRQEKVGPAGDPAVAIERESATRYACSGAYASSNSEARRSGREHPDRCFIDLFGDRSSRHDGRLAVAAL
jgi:hypothetical protein